MSPTHEQFAEYIRQVFPRLDRLTYYDLLGIPQSASSPEIRAAYYRMAADLHPDRYYNLPSRELKEQLETVYARICEGYRVLSVPEKRTQYTKALNDGQFRLVITERESKAPVNPEDSIKHEEAKKFFRLGMICFTRKDWKGAVLNLNFAKSFEPTSPLILQKLAEAKAASGKPTGPAGQPPR
jgi:curved DNA-binding protein CbpA